MEKLNKEKNIREKGINGGIKRVQIFKNGPGKICGRHPLTLTPCSNRPVNA